MYIISGFIAFNLTWLTNCIYTQYAVEQLYLMLLLNRILSLCGRGLYFAGKDSHVFRPMITAFCLPIKDNHACTQFIEMI